MLVAKKIVDVETKQARAKDCHSEASQASEAKEESGASKAREELLI